FFPGPISPGRRPADASAVGRAASAAATATTGTAATAAAAGTASWPASRGFLLFLFQGRHLGVQPPLVGEAAEIAGFEAVPVDALESGAAQLEAADDDVFQRVAVHVFQVVAPQHHGRVPDGHL